MNELNNITIANNGIQVSFISLELYNASVIENNNLKDKLIKAQELYKKDNDELRKEIEKLSELIKEKDIKIKELEDIIGKQNIRIYNLENKIEKLERDKIDHDNMMYTAEIIILYETYILKEVYGKDYDNKIKYHDMMSGYKNKTLEIDKLTNINKINETLLIDFANGIYDFNDWLKGLKEDRNYDSHDKYKQSTSNLTELETKMYEFIKNNKNIDEQPDYNYVANIVLNKIRLFGDYPFDVDKKYVLWEKVSELEPQITWFFDKKNKLKKETFDMSDAYVCGLAYFNKNKTTE